MSDIDEGNPRLQLKEVSVEGWSDQSLLQLLLNFSHDVGQTLHDLGLDLDAGDGHGTGGLGRTGPSLLDVFHQLVEFLCLHHGSALTNPYSYI